MNFMQTGEGASSASPVGLRCPVFESIRKTTILLEPWSAANRYEPVGSIEKLRGDLPSVETYSTALSKPFRPIANKAMVSCQRLEQYRNLQFECTHIAAETF